MNRDNKGKFMANEKLTTKQLEAIKIMVYEESNMTKVAERVGIGRATLYTWLNNEEFNKTFQKEKANYIRGLSSKAIANLEKLMQSPDSRTALKANLAILKQTQDFLNEIQISSGDQDITITLMGDDD
jgi:predicted DNA-binding protein (UPF0251 family)